MTPASWAPLAAPPSHSLLLLSLHLLLLVPRSLADSPPPPTGGRLQVPNSDDMASSSHPFDRASAPPATEGIQPLTVGGSSVPDRGPLLWRESNAEGHFSRPYEGRSVDTAWDASATHSSAGNRQAAAAAAPRGARSKKKRRKRKNLRSKRLKAAHRKDARRHSMLATAADFNLRWNEARNTWEPIREQHDTSIPNGDSSQSPIDEESRDAGHHGTRSSSPDPPVSDSVSSNPTTSPFMTFSVYADVVNGLGSGTQPRDGAADGGRHRQQSNAREHPTSSRTGSLTRAEASEAGSSAARLETEKRDHYSSRTRVESPPSGQITVDEYRVTTPLRGGPSLDAGSTAPGQYPSSGRWQSEVSPSPSRRKSVGPADDRRRRAKERSRYYIQNRLFRNRFMPRRVPPVRPPPPRAGGDHDTRDSRFYRLDNSSGTYLNPFDSLPSPPADRAHPAGDQQAGSGATAGATASNSSPYSSGYSSANHYSFTINSTLSTPHYHRALSNINKPFTPYNWRRHRPSPASSGGGPGVHDTDNTRLEEGEAAAPGREDEPRLLPVKDQGALKEPPGATVEAGHASPAPSGGAVEASVIGSNRSSVFHRNARSFDSEGSSLSNSSLAPPPPAGGSSVTHNRSDDLRGPSSSPSGRRDTARSPRSRHRGAPEGDSVPLQWTSRRFSPRRKDGPPQRGGGSAVPRAAPKQGRNSSHAAAPKSRPNIVLFITDDLDVELGSLNYMPRLQALLQRQGGLFPHSYTSTPMCCPSRSSLLTGMYIHNHEVYTNNDNCSSVRWQETHEQRTFATYLSDAGYSTGYFGKYLNKYKGPYTPAGWQDWMGLRLNSRYYNYTVYKNGNKIKYGDSYPRDYFPHVITSEGLRFLRENNRPRQHGQDERGGSGPRPTLLVLSYPAPHGPEDAAPEHSNLFMNATDHHTVAYDYAPNPDKQWILQYTGRMPPLNLKFTDMLMTKRLQTLQSVDLAIEKIVLELRRLKQLDNTYLFFTSDHGYHLGQFGLIKGKSMPFEFDIKVPLLVRGPGILPSTEYSQIALNVDLAPTFLDIAGVTPPPHMDGRSLLPLMGGREVVWRDSFLVESSGRHRDEDVLEMRAQKKYQQLNRLLAMEVLINTTLASSTDLTPSSSPDYASSSSSIPTSEAAVDWSNYSTDYSAGSGQAPVPLFTSKHEHLEVVCQSPELQAACSQRKKWRCEHDGVRWRLKKCRTAVAVRRANCVCEPEMGMGYLVRLDPQERRRQRAFLRSHVSQDLRRLSPRFLKAFVDVDSSEIARENLRPGRRRGDRVTRSAADSHLLPDTSPAADGLVTASSRQRLLLTDDEELTDHAAEDLAYPDDRQLAAVKDRLARLEPDYPEGPVEGEVYGEVAGVVLEGSSPPQDAVHAYVEEEELKDIERQIHDIFDELKDLKVASNSSDTLDIASYDNDTITEVVGGCVAVGGVAVDCPREVYQDRHAWRLRKHAIDQEIRRLGQQMRVLKVIRQHLRVSRPSVSGSRPLFMDYEDEGDLGDEEEGEDMAPSSGLPAVGEDPSDGELEVIEGAATTPPPPEEEQDLYDWDGLHEGEGVGAVATAATPITGGGGDRSSADTEDTAAPAGGAEGDRGGDEHTFAEGFEYDDELGAGEGLEEDPTTSGGGMDPNHFTYTGGYRGKKDQKVAVYVPEERAVCWCNRRAAVQHHVRQQKLQRIAERQRQRELRAAKRAARREKRKKQRQPRERPCNLSHQNCYHHDNDHWKTAPFWTDGSFCACLNAANNTYWCVRTINSSHNTLYCEFITGLITYYDLNIDPYQLRNVAFMLSNSEVAELHDMLTRLRSCRGSDQCDLRNTTATDQQQLDTSSTWGSVGLLPSPTSPYSGGYSPWGTVSSGSTTAAGTTSLGSDQLSNEVTLQAGAGRSSVSLYGSEEGGSDEGPALDLVLRGEGHGHHLWGDLSMELTLLEDHGEVGPGSSTGAGLPTAGGEDHSEGDVFRNSLIRPFYKNSRNNKSNRAERPSRTRLKLHRGGASSSARGSSGLSAGGSGSNSSRASAGPNNNRWNRHRDRSNSSQHHPHHNNPRIGPARTRPPPPRDGWDQHDNEILLTQHRDNSSNNSGDDGVAEEGRGGRRKGGRGRRPKKEQKKRRKEQRKSRKEKKRRRLSSLLGQPPASTDPVLRATAAGLPRVTRLPRKSLRRERRRRRRWRRLQEKLDQMADAGGGRGE